MCWNNECRVVCIDCVEFIWNTSYLVLFEACIYLVKFFKYAKIMSKVEI